jgi:RNA recognition motif-containing protein
MKNKLFFGGFPYETTEEELAELFGTCGTVLSLKVLIERGTGRSRGLGFVEMSTEEEARAALEKLDGSAVGERKMFVAEARPMEERPREERDQEEAPQEESSGAPGFVERRSGRDRRQSQGTPAAAKPAWAPSKKKWGDKPGGFPKKRPWERKPESRFAKKEGFGPKPWGPKREGAWERKPGGFAGKKPWGAKPEGGFPKKDGFGPKKWERKPGGFVGKKPWPKPEGARERKPGGFAGKKPWGAKPGFGPKKFGRKPGGFARGHRSGAGPGE